MSKSIATMEDKVVVKCYGKEKTYTRKEAIKEFTIAIQFSEGSEQQRYINILLSLMNGNKYCKDL